ncbi:UNVERIFIED_CONTAM: hypothetical protein RMT77_015382 [Armadillidium vulgare]
MDSASNKEKNSEGEEIGAQEPQTLNKNSDSPNQSSSHTKVGPLPAMKATVANPFKITPSSSWPLENNEQPSKPILAPPKFGANSVFGKYSSASSATQGKDLKISTTPTILVPLHEAPKPTFKLKPPVLGNTLSTSPVSSKRPASKLDSTSSSSSNDDGPDAKRVRVSTAEETPSVKESPAEASKSPEKDDTNSAAEKKEACSSSALPSTPEKNVSSSETQKDSPTTAIPTFVPLSNSSNKESPRSEESNSRVNGVGSTPPLSSKVGNAGFIFGQNLENRVSGVSPSSSAIFSNGETNPSSPTSGHNLFTAAANSIAATSATADGSKSLSESSRELSMKEESLKTKYEEVQVITGEEGERNVIQMNCKLYGWSSGSWQERGRGILRLNDREIRDELHSRLVIRTQGTLTVMLNAKIWAEMSIEKPNDKSVRFTATDVDGQPKIYLVMGSPKDITLLHNSLEYRVAAARSQTLDEKERESDQDQDTVSQLSV